MADEWKNSTPLMELENFVALEKSLPGNKYKETFNALLRKESVPPVYLMRVIASDVWYLPYANFLTYQKYLALELSRTYLTLRDVFNVPVDQKEIYFNFLNLSPTPFPTVSAQNTDIVQIISRGQYALYFQRLLLHAIHTIDYINHDVMGKVDETYKFRKSVIPTFRNLDLFPFILKTMTHEELFDLAESFFSSNADPLKISYLAPIMVQAYCIVEKYDDAKRWAEHGMEIYSYQGVRSMAYYYQFTGDHIQAHQYFTKLMERYPFEISKEEMKKFILCMKESACKELKLTETKKQMLKENFPNGAVEVTVDALAKEIKLLPKDAILTG